MFNAKKCVAATAKITRIMWRAAAKVTLARSEGCYVRRFAEIYRSGLIDGNARRLLRNSHAIAIAKLKTTTVATNETNTRRLLLISLKLRGSDIESRCIKSGGISGGVAALQRSDMSSKSRCSSSTTTSYHFSLSLVIFSSLSASIYVSIYLATWLAS